MQKKIKSFIYTIYLNSKYKYIQEFIAGSNPKILDIGAGNHSAKKLKQIFPDCKYYAVDISKDYNNDEDDFKLMEKFYEIDLTKLKFDEIHDNYFDLIIMSHIIEHLFNGDLVISKLISKLKKDGMIYIEFPSPRSTLFPRMFGTLNFFDDETHVRIYTLKEIFNILLQNNVRPLKGGVRRNYLRLALMPIIVPYRFIRTGRLLATDFWDLFGFAEFALGKKKN